MTTINAASAPISTIPALVDPIAPVPASAADSATRVSHKSRTVAALLMGLLAPFGAGDFYVGRWVTALLRIISGAFASVLVGLGYFLLSAGAGGANVAAESIGLMTVFVGYAVLAVWTIWYIASITQIVTRKGGYATDRQGLPLC